MVRVLAAVVGVLLLAVAVFVGRSPVALGTVGFVAIALLCYALEVHKLLPKTRKPKVAPGVTRREEFRRKGIRPPQDTVMNATFGKMVWLSDWFDWKCSPTVSFRGKSTTVPLIVYVGEDTVVTPIQEATWNRFARDADGLVAWAVEEFWKAPGNEAYTRGRALEEVVLKAELGEGAMGEDGKLGVSIEGGTLLDEDHCIVLVLGPGEQDKAVDVFG